MSWYAAGLWVLILALAGAVCRPAWPWLRRAWRGFWEWYGALYGPDSPWDDYWLRLAEELKRARAERERDEARRRWRLPD
jgi:hypothetical protein